MPRTWTQNSTIPSDRIPPSRVDSATPPNTSRRKAKNKDLQIPKSKAVVALEALQDGLRTSTGKDPKGGCFCQARDHQLSEYTPICRSCGLILCMLNAPHHSCPHCSSPLLTQVARETLAKRLAVELSDLLTREAEERERIASEARKAEGAFPPLDGRIGLPDQSVQNHKVLSLNSKTKKVTLSTYSSTPRPLSHRSRPHSPEEVEPVRVPPPPSVVVHAKSKIDTVHSWANLSGPCYRYIPITDHHEGQSTGMGMNPRPSNVASK